MSDNTDEFNLFKVKKNHGLIIANDQQSYYDQLVARDDSIIKISRWRNQVDLMRYPFFSISRHAKKEAMHYQSSDGSKFLEVRGTREYGISKIWDSDILTYAFSKATEMSLAYQSPFFPNTISFTAYEILNAIGRKTGSNDYKWLMESLRRLSTTTYETNIFSEIGVGSSAIFPLINIEYDDKIPEGKVGKFKGRIIFRICDQVVKSINDNRKLISIEKTNFKEMSGIKRKIHEIVSITKVPKTMWQIRLSLLKSMCGSDLEDKIFKRQLKNTKLPWRVLFTENTRGECKVVFGDK